ncbi:hypothetical protein JTB14_033919 [Gonioctena quinquepunctata]|nr:hypothetical protein JTB14_033919 [Gonioctena quinquepunctata]
MDEENTFKKLFELVTPYIGREDTILRQAVSAEARLVATLRNWSFSGMFEIFHDYFTSVVKENYSGNMRRYI